MQTVIRTDIPAHLSQYFAPMLIYSLLTAQIHYNSAAQCIYNNNNNNKQICIAPSGRNFRGAEYAFYVRHEVNVVIVRTILTKTRV